MVGCVKVRNSGFEAFSKLENLEVLDVRECKGITEEGLLDLGKCTNLKSLYCYGCGNVTEEGLCLIWKEIEEHRILNMKQKHNGKNE